MLNYPEDVYMKDCPWEDYPEDNEPEEPEEDMEGMEAPDYWEGER